MSRVCSSFRLGWKKNEREARLRTDARQTERSRISARLPLTILPATDEMVFFAAALKIEYSLSYADAFAVAASQKLGGILVTGDPEINQLRKIIRIKKLNRHSH